MMKSKKALLIRISLDKVKLRNGRNQQNLTLDSIKIQISQLTWSSLSKEIGSMAIVIFSVMMKLLLDKIQWVSHLQN